MSYVLCIPIYYIYMYKKIQLQEVKLIPNMKKMCLISVL